MKTPTRETEPPGHEAKAIARMLRREPAEG